MKSEPIRSVPALAAALRQTDRYPLPDSATQIFSIRPLAPAYQVQNGTLEKEANTAVNTIAQVADRLRRLASAYGEWETFDASAYFDLWPEHAPRLVQVQERVSTVHVIFFADLLLPSFRRTEQYWAQEFFPAYQSARPFPATGDERSTYTSHFLEIEQPKMLAYWEKLRSVLAEVRRQLWDDIGFLAAAAGADEKANWREAWQGAGAQGLDERLLPALRQLSTLTLAVEFPLPAYRQPGRVRRLRRMWQSGNWRRR